jgi:hypothetical protein
MDEIDHQEDLGAERKSGKGEDMARPLRGVAPDTSNERHVAEEAKHFREMKTV